MHVAPGTIKVNVDRASRRAEIPLDLHLYDMNATSATARDIDVA